MGVIICTVHGRQFIDLVSIGLQKAVRNGKIWSSDEVVKVLCEIARDYPLPRRWLDRASAGDLAGQVISFDQSMDLAPSPVCSACLEQWLQASGVDTAFSPEEQRFVDLRDSLHELLEPRLREGLERMSVVLLARARTSAGTGVMSEKGLSFVAYASSDSAGSVVIEVADQASHLTGMIRSSVPGISVPPHLGQPLSIGLLAGRIDLADRPRLERWGADLEAFLVECLARLS